MNAVSATQETYRHHVKEDLPATLAAERRELAESRIKRAAAEVVAKRGFGSTIEEIAQASGVSVRTITRYYPSHDQLIAAALSEIFQSLTRPVGGLPDPSQDLDGWLGSVCLVAHSRFVNILGRAFWDSRLARPDRSDSQTMGRAGQQFRLNSVKDVTSVAWTSAGGSGEPPGWLVETFTLYLSAFTTRSLAMDFGHSFEQVAALATHNLKILLRAAVEEQHGAQGSKPGPG